MKAQIVAGISNNGFSLQSVIVFDEEVINEWKEHFANRDRKPEVWEFNHENFMKTVKDGASVSTVYYNLSDVGFMVENGYPEVQDFPANLKEIAIRCHNSSLYEMMEEITIFKRAAQYE